MSYIRFINYQFKLFRIIDLSIKNVAQRAASVLWWYISGEVSACIRKLAQLAMAHYVVIHVLHLRWILQCYAVLLECFDVNWQLGYWLGIIVQFGRGIFWLSWPAKPALRDCVIAYLRGQYCRQLKPSKILLYSRLMHAPYSLCNIKF